MKKNTALLTVIAVSLVAGQTLQAAIPTWAKVSGGMVLAASIFRFYSKKGSNDANRVKAADLLDWTEIEKLPTNAWYAYDDIIIGHPKESNTLVAEIGDDGKATGKLVPKAGHNARGAFGFIHSQFKPFQKTLGALAILAALYQGLGEQEAGKFGESKVKVNGLLALFGASSLLAADSAE